MRDGYDPARTAVGAGLGVVTGAAAKSAAEVLGRPGRRTAFANYEAIPGHGTGHLPQLVEQPYAVREAYSADPRSSWIDPNTGEDVIYRALGIDTLPTSKTIGAFESPGGPLEINPAWSARPQVEMRGSLDVNEASRNMLNAAEATRGYIDAQNMAAWHMPIEVDRPALGNSLAIKLNRPLESDQIITLTKIARKYGFVGVTNRNSGFSLIPSDKTRMLSDSMWANLEQELRNHGLRDPAPVRYVGDEIDYQRAFAAKPGTGQATEQLRANIENAFGSLEKLDADPQFRAMLLRRIERDAELEKPMGGVREDVQRREVIARSGLRGLFEALARKEFLPTVLLPLGLAHLYEGAATRE